MLQYSLVLQQQQCSHSSRQSVSTQLPMPRHWTMKWLRLASSTCSTQKSDRAWGWGSWVSTLSYWKQESDTLILLWRIQWFSIAKRKWIKTRSRKFAMPSISSWARVWSMWWTSPSKRRQLTKSRTNRQKVCITWMSFQNRRSQAKSAVLTHQTDGATRVPANSLNQ